jgi:hypothetical protein
MFFQPISLPNGGEMKLRSLLLAVLPLPIALGAGAFIGWVWPNFTIIVPFFVAITCALAPMLVLLLLKRRSVLITLPTSWLCWYGMAHPLLGDPALLGVQIEAGCFQGCVCQGYTGECAPFPVQPTYADALIFVVVGALFLTAGSLLISAIDYLIRMFLKQKYEDAQTTQTS